MTPLYEWEETLIKERYFEPLKDGYKIDNLMRNDRNVIAGMLYTLYWVIEDWREKEEKRNRQNGIMGMIANEHLAPSADRLEELFMSRIRGFIVDAIDAKKTSTESAETETMLKRD